MKVALVHDYLNQSGGAEKVLLGITEILPAAPIYTLIYDPAAADPRFRKMDVRTSALQKMPFAKGHYEKYLALYPLFVEQMDMSGYDLVVSDSSAWAKGVLTFPPTCHITYLHAPMRFAWENYRPAVSRRRSFVERGVLEVLLNYFRLWDVVSARRADYIACNSNEVRRRIEKYYGRTAEVIYPPVDTDFYGPYDNGAGASEYINNAHPNGYFLVVSRLKQYKKIDQAVDAFRGLEADLAIVGDGPELRRVSRYAPPNVRFYGRRSDEDVRELYRNCRAFIMTAREDFGIAPVEAMACGRPVIAFGEGGARDTVADGITGVLYGEQTPGALREAVAAFDPEAYDPNVIRSHALQFSKARFKKEMYDFIMSCYDDYRSRGGLIHRPEPVREGELSFGAATPVY